MIYWINISFHTQNIPQSLANQGEIDLTTTWPVELSHKLVKHYEIPDKPRCDEFIWLCAEVLEENDVTLLYDIQREQTELIKQLADTGKWGDGKSSRLSRIPGVDDGLYRRWENIKLYYNKSTHLNSITWTSVEREIKRIPNIKCKLHCPDGTNLNHRRGFRNDGVRESVRMYLDWKEHILGESYVEFLTKLRSKMRVDDDVDEQKNDDDD